MKKVLRYLGVNLTKQTFAKTASKVVPVIGGAISGGMTYAAYKPGAERLRRYLRSLPISRIDESMYPDLVAIEADKAAVTRNQAIKDAKAAALNATQTAGELAAGVVGAASTAATEGLQTAGEKVEDALDTASRFIGSIRAQRRLEKKASTQQNEKPSDVFDANLEKVKSSRSSSTVAFSRRRSSTARKGAPRALMPPPLTARTCARTSKRETFCKQTPQVHGASSFAW